jgi:hypothetical protein
VTPERGHYLVGEVLSEIDLGTLGDAGDQAFDDLADGLAISTDRFGRQLARDELASWAVHGRLHGEDAVTHQALESGRGALPFFTERPREDVGRLISQGRMPCQRLEVRVAVNEDASVRGSARRGAHQARAVAGEQAVQHGAEIKPPVGGIELRKEGQFVYRSVFGGHNRCSLPGSAHRIIRTARWITTAVMRKSATEVAQPVASSPSRRFMVVEAACDDPGVSVEQRPP